MDDNFEHTEPASVHYMQQILQGVAFMHRQNIVHLDLKPENIVCVDTTGTSIKIIDFGLASKLGGWERAPQKPLSTSFCSSFRRSGAFSCEMQMTCFQTTARL